MTRATCLSRRPVLEGDFRTTRFQPYVLLSTGRSGPLFFTDLLRRNKNLLVRAQSLSRIGLYADVVLALIGGT